MDESVLKLNSFLPDCIRVFAIKKVTAGFNSKTACDARSYVREFYSESVIWEIIVIFKIVLQSYTTPTFAFTPKESTPSYDYRITCEVLEELNAILSAFMGTKSYHNFTSGKQPQDPSCKRYVTHFSSSQPYLVRDVEFIKITIKGL